MNRRRLALLAALLLVPLALAAPVGAAFVGNRPLQARALDGLGAIVPDGYTSVGLLDVGGGRYALVDAGNDPEGAAIRAALAERGAGPEAVDAIFFTHGHPDHTAACALFPNARVYAMRAEQPTLEGQRAYLGPLPRLFGPKPAPCAVTGWVEDGAEVRVGERSVQGFLTPGHTTGSAAWLVDGVLFVGDSLSAKTEGLHGAPWVFTDDTDQNLRSMRALAQRVSGLVRLVVPSHTGTANAEELAAL